MRFMGDIDLLGNRLLTPSIEGEPSRPTTGVRLGRLCFSGGVLAIAVEVASGVPTVWVPLTNEVTTHVHEQADPSDRWVVEHGLATEAVIATAYDGSGAEFVPDAVRVLGPNALEVVTSGPVSGRALVIASSGTGDGLRATPSKRHVQSVPSDVWTIRHRLGEDPVVQVISGGKVVIPAYVRHLDPSTVEIGFDSPATGEARCV